MSTKLRYLFTLICSICLFTACGDDDDKGEGGGGDTTWEQVAGSYEGDKLAFSYGETTLTGKKATFTATNSSNGSLALTNVIPGEETTTISDIKVENSAFSGTVATTNANVEYTGSVKDDVMTLKLNVVMKDPNGWAKKYSLAEYTNGELTYNGHTNETAVVAGAGYVKYENDSDNGIAYGAMFRAMFGILLPQVLQSVTLEPDGNITAEYLPGNKITMEPMWALAPPLKDVVNGIIPTAGWVQSPKHLAYWFEKDGKLYIKLNIEAILVQVMGENAASLSEMVSTILTSEPSVLKGLLGQLMGVSEIPVSDDTIRMLQEWVINGVPMNVTAENGHTYMYLNKENWDPIMKMRDGSSDLIQVWNMLDQAGILPSEAGMAGMLLPTISQGWDATETFDLGLDLVAQ